ncbi:response regulator transcription factor [Leucobacter sp. M11]|uniref:response regulator transcription factor n=1 Tax=Leucobacter sp. M11 TaxID=2993565 RepID=UPI002D7E5E46|nr:response regulator transcription factor [Leucobacter sp. M11]MEB4616330.1 response regulator transcription factor [Leucobacter sp. M11]
MTDIRVLIADDEPRIRAALRLLIEHEPGMIVAGEARDGVEAVEQARRLRPDTILMDIQMPRMTGLDATRALAADNPRIIVLTTFDLDEYVFEALRLGASGFLLKNSPPTDVLRAIRAAVSGDALLAPEVTRRLITRFASPPPTPAASGTLLGTLTARERETLLLIAEGRSNAEIAEALFLTATTVRTYVSRILTKLGARDRAQLVVAAYESGLVAPPRPE